MAVPGVHPAGVSVHLPHDVQPPPPDVGQNDPVPDPPRVSGVSSPSPGQSSSTDAPASQDPEISFNDVQRVRSFQLNICYPNVC